jgi:hypothetical protein
VQRGADVNRLATIAALIFAEFLHAENFTQRRGDAKKFFDLCPHFAMRRRPLPPDFCD